MSWANSAGPDQTAPKVAVCIRVYTFGNSICILFIQNCITKPTFSVFRTVTVLNFGILSFRNFTICFAVPEFFTARMSE